MKHFITIIILALSISACSFKDETITNDSGTISVTQPSLWFDMESLNDESDINIGNPVFEAYFIILIEPNSDLPDGFSLEQYSEATRENIKAGSESYTEHHDTTFTSLNKIPAIKYTINATVDNVEIQYWHITLKSKKRFYQLIAWSLPSKFKSNIEKFNLTINSFRELK